MFFLMMGVIKVLMYFQPDQLPRWMKRTTSCCCFFHQDHCLFICNQRIHWAGRPIYDPITRNITCWFPREEAHIKYSAEIIHPLAPGRWELKLNVVLLIEWKSCWRPIQFNSVEGLAVLVLVRGNHRPRNHHRDHLDHHGAPFCHTDH